MTGTSISSLRAIRCAFTTSSSKYGKTWVVARFTANLYLIALAKLCSYDFATSSSQLDFFVHKSRLNLPISKQFNPTRFDAFDLIIYKIDRLGDVAGKNGQKKSWRDVYSILIKRYSMSSGFSDFFCIDAKI